ncbi:MAG: helix-turn-helix domain-containing protein [Micropruina sp.]|uniref:TetR/AcrR family transcriptional regulator n=1 Tax=Micropruina sp. TaxID=2737536 RepID=UPI0039E5A29A
MAAAKYSSTLRAEQAAQTRQRVLAAAAELFATRGFTRTTLALIAQSAGVSVETVQAQGSKRSLLSAAIHWRTFGEADENRFFSTARAREIFEAATPDEICARASGQVTDFNASTFRIWRTFVSAAGDDPVVDAELTELARFIRGQCREIVAVLASRDWLRSDVPVGELGDSLWVLIGSENYERLTVRLGWPPERYQDWLARSLSDLLFPAD